jgi:hypothetical protein
MDNYKLKMKIGIHEFEAEGPADAVQAQFASFRELLAATPAQRSEPVMATAAPAPASEALPHLPLEKILKTEGRVVSLTAKCDTVDEALLLILLGQKEARNNQEVTGAEIMDGLKQSGYVLPRIDRIMDKLADEGSIIAVGINRGRRYRLTNIGLTKALGIAKEVIATVP